MERVDFYSVFYSSRKDGRIIKLLITGRILVLQACVTHGLKGEVVSFHLIPKSPKIILARFLKKSTGPDLCYMSEKIVAFKSNENLI